MELEVLNDNDSRLKIGGLETNTWYNVQIKASRVHAELRWVTANHLHTEKCKSDIRWNQTIISVKETEVKSKNCTSHIIRQFEY